MQNMRIIKPSGRDWLSQVFQCQATYNGGVIRRLTIDVEREVGVAAFHAEVRRRGFRLIRTQQHLIVVCNNGPVEVMC